MRVTFSLLIAVALAIGAAAPGGAAAALLTPAGHAPPRVERLQLAAPVLAPMAFSRFCLSYREDCEIHRLRDAAGVGRARWAEVTRVNAAVNMAIAPREDDGDVVDETWRVAPAAGACHDYAVTKRHELIKLGWPSRALLLAEVVTRWGEHHLVLVVRTRAGDFVADNLYPGVRPWRAAPYRWVRIQSPDNPLYWSTVSADVETADQPSRDAAPELGADDTLVAADAVEIAAAEAERNASQATDSLWALEAPSQRYVFDASLDGGGFRLEGAVALAQPVPSVSPEPPPAPIVTVAEATDSSWALEAPSQRYVFDASLDQGGFGLEGAFALAQPLPSASSEPRSAPIVTDGDAIDPLSLTVSVGFDRDMAPDRSGYGWLVTMD